MTCSCLGAFRFLDNDDLLVPAGQEADDQEERPGEDADDAGPNNGGPGKRRRHRTHLRQRNSKTQDAAGQEDPAPGLGACRRLVNDGDHNGGPEHNARYGVASVKRPAERGLDDHVPDRGEQEKTEKGSQYPIDHDASKNRWLEFLNIPPHPYHPADKCLILVKVIRISVAPFCDADGFPVLRGYPSIRFN